MLMLTIRQGEPLHIVLEDQREITINLAEHQTHHGVSLGVEAPRSITVIRHKLWLETRAEAADRKVPSPACSGEPNDK
jgi:sRNA-binding carbon storage regulator CsrA